MINNLDKSKALNKHEKYIADAKTRDASTLSTEDAKLALNPRLEVKIEETIVEKFFIDGHKFTQLSDHYGISA